MIKRKFVLKANVCLVGLPGSGKGYYGRLLCSEWDVPLYSTSQILRTTIATTIMSHCDKLQKQQQQHVMASGKLMDCDTVSTIVNQFLQDRRSNNNKSTYYDFQQQQLQTFSLQRNPLSISSLQINRNGNSNRNRNSKSNSNCFIMDGYPRTVRQVQLMEERWDMENQISIVLHLDIPPQVCIEKILGRRICALCHKEPNLAHVRYGDYDLPPTRPTSVEHCIEMKCNPTKHWNRRDDDVSSDIVLQRINIHQSNEQSILDYYNNNNDNKKSIQKREYDNQNQNSSQHQHHPQKLWDSSTPTSVIKFAPHRGQLDFPESLAHIQNELISIGAGEWHDVEED